MGGAVGVPESVDYDTLNVLAGNRISKELFIGYEDSKGFISRQKIEELCPKLTDCFLTHDWGKDELNRSNHDRVARVNASLKQRGLITWFDSERMMGNIVQQMCSGIDFAQCIVVFVTKNYMEKVGGENANDNCQLEFNFAVRRKSSARMIAVVMESRMRDTKLWKGPLGIVLGGSLYIDFVSDDNWETQCDNLYKSIVQMITPYDTSLFENSGANSVQQFPLLITRPTAIVATSNTSTSPGKSTKPLIDLTVAEVTCLLINLKLGTFASAFALNGVDGVVLSYIRSDAELARLGLHHDQKSRYLFSYIEERKALGVQLSMIVPSALTASGIDFASPQVSPRTAAAVTAATNGPPSISSPSSSSPHKKTSALQQQTVPNSNESLELLIPRHAMSLQWYSSNYYAYSLSSVHPVHFHASASSEQVLPPCVSVHIRGCNGAAAATVNGVYDMVLNDMCEGMPVYNKRVDPNIWIELNGAHKSWQVKPLSGRGTGKCLAEIGAVNEKAAAGTVKSLHECIETTWKIAEGGAFVDNHTAKLLPTSQSIWIYRSSGVKGNKLNGLYHPTEFLQGGLPVFQRNDDPDMWLEYNGKLRQWQLKSTPGRGADGCLAFLTCEPAVSLVQCTSEVWKVSDGSSFGPQREMIAKWMPRNVILRDVTFPKLKVLNGEYRANGELNGGGFPVYRKEDEVDIWIEYSSKQRQWQIKTTQGRGTEACMAYIHCEPDISIDLCCASEWHISDGTGSMPRHPIAAIIPGAEAVHVRGSSGPLAKKLDGVYVPCAAYSDLGPVYSQLNDHTVIMEFNAAHCAWQIKPNTAMHTGKCWAELPICQSYKHVVKAAGDGQSLSWLVNRVVPPELCNGKTPRYMTFWKVSDGSSALIEQPEMKVYKAASPLCITGAKGSRSTLLNGIYIPSTNMISDGMHIYWRVSAAANLNDAAMLQTITDAQRSPPVAGDETIMWLSFNRSRRRWGVHKGEAVMIAENPECVISPEYCSAAWSVYDDTAKWTNQQTVRVTVVLMKW